MAVFAGLLFWEHPFAAEQPGRRIERSFLGSPASPAFGRPTPPAFEPAAEPVEPVLPAPEAPTDPPGAPGGPLPGLQVREVRILGNTALAEAELREVTAPYEGRWVSVLELHELRQRLSLAYLRHGYVNSGALIPDQEVRDGVLEVRVLEGRLTAIRLSGNSLLSDDYLRERIVLGADAPLNVLRLGERLQIVQSHPAIRSLGSELVPGVRPGEAGLDVQVREAEPFQVLVDLGNAHAPSVGEWSAGGEVAHLSLTGRGDRLALRLEGGEGLRNAALSYAVPLNARDTTLAIQLQRDNALVVSSPFQDLDIEGTRQIGVISLSHPLVRDLERQFLLSAGLEVEENRSTLAGEPFSFAPWAEDGRSKVALVYFGQDWLQRGRDRVMALRSTFKLGLDAFDATDRDQRPDGQFFSWLAQAQWARRLAPDRQIILRGELQLSSDPLMSMEQYALGGLNNVRGYRTNQLVRDSAFFASLEYRVGLGGTGDTAQPLQLALFADYGTGWNRDPGMLGPHSIYSLGAGLLWDPDPAVHAELFWGAPLREVDNLGHSIQDDGIHFRILLNASAWRGT